MSITDPSKLPERPRAKEVWTYGGAKKVVDAIKAVWSSYSLVETLLAFEIVWTGIVEGFGRHMPLPWYLVVGATMFYVYQTLPARPENEEAHKED